MNKDIIKEIRKIVEKEANDDEDIKYHIKKVVKYALILARKYQLIKN